MNILKRFFAILKEAFWLVFAIGIVAGGFFGFRLMGQLREPVEPAPIERVVPLVQTIALTPHETTIPIRGEGFVTAAQQIELATQSAGRIIDLHPAIKALGQFEQGDVLVRLDDRTATAAVNRANADMASIEARLQLVNTQVERAKQLLDRGIGTQDRLDQLLSQQSDLQASLAGLSAGLETAQIALENTKVLAPFDGAVLSQSADIGAFVNPGQSIAILFTDQQLEVTVPVIEADAALIPGLFESQRAPAIVTAQFAGSNVAWNAEVVRVDPALNSTTRTLGVTVALLDRYSGEMVEDADSLASGVPPALVNAFVEAEISGAQLDDIYAIPSIAVRENDNVWLTDGDTLSVVPVNVVHIDLDTAFVRFSAPPATRDLVVGTLDAPVDGMAVARQSDVAAE